MYLIKIIKRSTEEIQDEFFSYTLDNGIKQAKARIDNSWVYPEHEVGNYFIRAWKLQAIGYDDIEIEATERD
jgi:hypothetical protein